MTIHLDNNSYIIGIWFNSNELNDDIMTFAYKEKNNSDFKIKIRFRKKIDNKVFDNEDKKIWFDLFDLEEKNNKILSEDEIIKMLNNSQEKIKILLPFSDKIIVMGNIDKLIKLSENKSWFNIMSTNRPFTDKVNTH